MANGNTVTLVGNITRDPELRFTNTGQATASFGLAVNRRWQNRQTQEWEEATSFFDVVCWREMAENAAESLVKGSRVIVTGRLDQRSWETPEGDSRSKVEVVADEIGPSIRWATAQVTKNERRAPGDGPPARGGSGGSAGRRIRADRHPIPRDTDTARSPSRHGTQQRPRRSKPPGTEGHRPANQEEAVRLVQGPRRVGRLQGRGHAPEVHERPRQDPGPPGVRATAPSTSATWPSPSRRPGSWSSCPIRSGPPRSDRAAGAAAAATGRGVADVADVTPIARCRLLRGDPSLAAPRARDRRRTEAVPRPMRPPPRRPEPTGQPTHRSRAAEPAEQTDGGSEEVEAASATPAPASPERRREARRNEGPPAQRHRRGRQAG